MASISIDGVEYVPATTVVSKESRDMLAKAYGIAYTYGCYDPDSEAKSKPLIEVWDCLKEVNKELKFKK